jgi:Glycosyl transferase family group 2
MNVLIHNRFNAPHNPLNSSNLSAETFPSSSDGSLSSVEEGDGGCIHVPLVSETTSWLDYLLEPRIGMGRYSIPLQSEARPWLKYLILVPLMSVGSVLLFSYFCIPLLITNGVFEFLDKFVAHNRFAVLIVCGIPIVLGLAHDLCTEITTYILLLRGRRRRQLPDHVERLTHAVIICNYKEPLDTLRATIQSLADNTLAESTMVVLACEDRDPTAKATYQSLEREFASSFHSFFKTNHKLIEGEVTGKSSNENFACQELYKMIVEEGIDPFQVMVTTCDADSLFDTVYLEQVEAEYCRMPDGRRFIYNSPINTYRNLPECNALVRAFEVLRCQYDTFNGITGFRPAQSNYSLTLGFAQEINFWDPTNTSEDFHMTLKAMATTGLGESVVVKVWSLILNDSVVGFSDRWVQAKRHMWGIEEVAFVASLFPVIRLNQWIALLKRVCSQMFGVCSPPFLLCCVFVSPFRQAFFALQVQTQYSLVMMYLVAAVYRWIKMTLREVFLYRCILSDRSLMMKRTWGEWLQFVLFWPITVQLASIIFATCATWRMLLHAVFHQTLVYVTAPKALRLSSADFGGAAIMSLSSMPKKGI